MPESATSAFYSSREWLLGDGAQRQWAERMARGGNVVLPTYCMSDDKAQTKAPMLLTGDKLLVAPDMLIMGNEKVPRWHEVKAKAKPSWFRKHRRWEHGCDYSLLLDYREVQRKTGSAVAIIVHEVASPTDPFTDSPLKVSSVWLGIWLSRAFEVGEERPLWPRGFGSARRGLGGWLWARNEMTAMAIRT